MRDGLSIRYNGSPAGQLFYRNRCLICSDGGDGADGRNLPTWFITGASSGFGLAFAKYALDRGYSVVATARSVNKLEELAAQAPDRVLTHKLDVTVVDDAEQAVPAAILRFGRIDVLINNAGYEIVGAVEETPIAEFGRKWTPISLARCQ